MKKRPGGSYRLCISIVYVEVIMSRVLAYVLYSVLQASSCNFAAQMNNFNAHISTLKTPL